MIVNYSDETTKYSEKSIFLAGPTPRDKKIISWRKEAVRILEELDFNGIVYVPEYKSYEPLKNYIGQVEWEKRGLDSSSVIVFWVPRSLPDMPAFTTNVEFGLYLSSGKIIYGRPDDSVKNKYLDYIYEKEYKIKPINNLSELLEEAIKLVEVKNKK